MTDTPRPKALGCYIFAGGFTVGVSKSFEIVGHLEGIRSEDKEYAYGVPTFSANFPKVPVWQSVSTWPLSQLANDPPDFIYANPPCAAWSVAGASLHKGKTNWLKDPRVGCVKNVFRVLREVQPTVLVWESVTQAFTRGRGLIVELTREAHALGYRVTYLLTNAFIHGVPQPRRRFLMFCHKVALQLPMPEGKVRNVQEVLGLREIMLPDGSSSWAQDVPVWGEPEMNPRYYRLARATAQGEALVDTWLEVSGAKTKLDAQEVMEENQPAFMAHRLSLKGMGQTFTSMVAHLHPIWNRWIANSEVGALCGWPADYRWLGDLQEIRAQMTQAVLPPVGEYIGQCVAAALKRAEPVDLTGSPELVSHNDWLFDGRI